MEESMTNDERQLREDLVRFARRMLRAGLVTGTAGNLSARSPGADRCLVTPSGVDYESMEPGDLVLVGLDGETLSDGLRPSVDTPMHLAVYRARADVGAFIHTHSPYAAAFSAVHRPIPPLITEAAGFLGGPVRVMGYVPPAVSDTGGQVADGLGSDRAALLPNHGVVAVGETLAKCFHAAVSVEESAHVAFLASQLGDPRQVPPKEVRRMHEFIHHRYGQPA
jgi:ribulose-5-phosphate 4-epimerase/fuculose-1-phosphate aldolase